MASPTRHPGESPPSHIGHVDSDAACSAPSIKPDGTGLGSLIDPSWSSGKAWITQRPEQSVGIQWSQRGGWEYKRRSRVMITAQGATTRLYRGMKESSCEMREEDDAFVRNGARVA